MVNFDFYTPTYVLFGKDTEQQTGKLVKQFGGNKVLLHYGGQSAEKSGLLGRVRACLQEAGIDFVELGGVQANPLLSLVRQGVALCKAEQVDFLLAVGGGSVIDSCKAIGYSLANNCDAWEFFGGKRQAEAQMPIGTVLTIAAAGSEMSNSAVITNDELGQKHGYGHDIYGRVCFSIMNPELTYTLPPYQTASGCADILMHTLERYFTTVPDTLSITDDIAEALIRNVMQSARILCRDPENYQARADIMWAGSLSHNGLTSAGNGKGDWATHQLGHELSAKYGLAHGASLCAMWGSWARYVYKHNPQRFVRLAENVLDLEPLESDEATALAGIEEMENFFWAIEMPTTMGEAEIEPSDADIADMVHKCSRENTRKIGDILPLGEAEMTEIYKMAK